MKKKKKKKKMLDCAKEAEEDEKAAAVWLLPLLVVGGMRGCMTTMLLLLLLMMQSIQLQYERQSHATRQASRLALPKSLHGSRLTYIHPLACLLHRCIWFLWRAQHR
jgi:hypothetical protein